MCPYSSATVIVILYHPLLMKLCHIQKHFALIKLSAFYLLHFPNELLPYLSTFQSIFQLSSLITLISCHGKDIIYLLLNVGILFIIYHLYYLFFPFFIFQLLPSSFSCLLVKSVQSFLFPAYLLKEYKTCI